MEESTKLSDPQEEINLLKAELAKEKLARKLAEQKYDEERRKVDSVLDGLPALVWIKDDKNNIVYVNNAAAESRGCKREDLQGKSTFELYPDDAEKYFEDDLQIINSKQARVGIVEQILSSSGEKRWVSTAKYPWFDESGIVIGVIVISTDITEVVRQQDQRDNLMAAVASALELSEERYYLAIRGSNDGVWDWNLRSNEVFYSPRYKELLGYRDDEYSNHFESFRSHVHPHDLPQVLAAVQAHLKDKEPYETEFRMLHKNGEYMWFSARGQAIWDKHDEPYRMSGSQRDITDRKQAEQNVNEFFSTVSHELRTPLAAVKGSLRLIEAGLAGAISDEARELLDIALSSCERLIRLVNDILDLRKIEAGRVELSIKKVNSTSLIESVIQGLSPFAEFHGVQLIKECIDEVEFEADLDRVVQVMTNLVGNAIKFSGKGSTVKLRVEKSSALIVRFSVEDDGPGIPVDKQHLLFMKFKQLDASDSRRQDGTGLGLAICKALVLQHQGKIGLNSYAGQGATFWFEVPVYAVRDRPH